MVNRFTQNGFDVNKADYALGSFNLYKDLAQECKDFYAGDPFVRNVKYLPKYRSESQRVYDMRSKSTTFVNYYAPVVDALTALITSAPPVIEGFSNEGWDKVSDKDEDLNSFIAETTRQSLIQGVTLVALLSDEDSVKMKRFDYEDLMSYQVDENNEIVQIVIRENVTLNKGAFGSEIGYRYLVFRIGGGEVWIGNDKTKALEKVEEWSNALSYIPVFPLILGKIEGTLQAVPPLYDIMSMNMVNFNREGNIANLINIASNPIPVIYGEVGEDTVSVGVDDALYFTDKSTQGFEYVEVTGTSISLISEKADNDLKLLDKVTFDILIGNTSNRTVADATHNAHRSSAMIKLVSSKVGSAFSDIIFAYAEMRSIAVKADATVTFKLDFEKEIVEINVAKELYMAGKMSRKTFYSVLSKGELPKDFNVDLEGELIEKELNDLISLNL